MNLFQEGESECAKCGSFSQHYVRYEGEVVLNAAGAESIRNEYLLRSCKRCTYEWKEACLS